MPPIPKFAKEIAKRAKAKPKVIASKQSQTKQLSQKFAKARKKGIRKSLEKGIPKKSKDYFKSIRVIKNRSDFIKIANELKNTDVKEFKEVTDFLSYIQDYIIFLEYANKHLKKDSIILGKLIYELKNLKISKADSVTSNVKKIALEIKSVLKKQ